MYDFSQLPPEEALEQVEQIVEVESEEDSIIAEDVTVATEICLELASIAAQDPEVWHIYLTASNVIITDAM